MITVKDIEKRLHVSNMEVMMCLYSGALPNYSEHTNDIQGWKEEHIEPFIKILSDRLERKRRYKDGHHNTIVSGILTFPTHQR